MISVIMPVFNTNKNELEEAISSILNQTYKDFEFIIYDDGSNIETKEYLKEIKTKDNRIKLILNEKNNGLPYSLNACIREASGDYIARMDADDISEENRFEKQINFLEEHKDIDVVGCNAYFFDENGIFGERNHSEYITEKDFLFTCPLIHPTIIFRKQVFENDNLYSLSKTVVRVEDYELLMRLYSQGKKLYNIQDKLFKIRTVRETYKRRKYIYRVNEAITRFVGYKRIHILHYAWPFVLKPLIVGLIPSKILKLFHKRRQS